MSAADRSRMSWNLLEVIVDLARDIKPNGRPGYLPIEIRIDGRDLIEIVREIERRVRG